MKYKLNPFFIIFLFLSLIKVFASKPEESPSNLIHIKRAFSSDDASESVGNPLSGLDYWQGPGKEAVDWTVEFGNAT